MNRPIDHLEIPATRQLATDEEILRLQESLDRVRLTRAVELLDHALKIAGYRDGIEQEQAEALTDLEEAEGMLDDMEARMGVYVEPVRRMLGL